MLVKVAGLIELSKSVNYKAISRPYLNSYIYQWIGRIFRSLARCCVKFFDIRISSNQRHTTRADPALAFPAASSPYCVPSASYPRHETLRHCAATALALAHCAAIGSGCSAAAWSARRNQGPAPARARRPRSACRRPAPGSAASDAAGRFIVVASPDYWARHGMPQRPEDLERHVCLPIRALDGTLMDLWTFTRGGEQASVSVRSWLLSANSHRDMTVQLGLAGVGVMRILDWTTLGRAGRRHTGAGAWRLGVARGGAGQSTLSA